MLALWEALCASLGVLLLVAGFLIRVISGDADPSGNVIHHYDLIPDILGMVIFLISILFYLHRLIKVAEHSTSKIDVISRNIDGIVSEISQQLKPLEARVSDLKAGYDREPLFATVTPVIAALKSTRNDYIFSAFAATLEGIAKRYLESTAINLNIAHHNRVQPASLDDIAPVCAFLEQLAGSIPDGSVWLGLSLLTSIDAWEGDDKYTRWSRLLRERGRSGTVHICRIWCMTDRRQLDGLRAEMEKQSSDNVTVRYLPPEAPDLIRLINDLSLIWIRDFNSQEINRTALAENPIAALRASRYRPLPSLLFRVLPGAAYLDSVAAESEEQTEVRNESYETVWARAKPFVHDAR